MEAFVGLQNILATPIPACPNATVAQLVDLELSQHWLRAMMWQLADNQGYISSTGSDRSLTFHHLIEVGTDLMRLLKFKLHDSGFQGPGLVSTSNSVNIPLPAFAQVY